MLGKIAVGGGKGSGVGLFGRWGSLMDMFYQLDDSTGVTRCPELLSCEPAYLRIIAWPK